MISHKLLILNRIKRAVSKFKSRTIDSYTLAEIVYANVEALDGNEALILRKALLNLEGNFELVRYTVGLNDQFQSMIEELEKFEKVIDAVERSDNKKSSTIEVLEEEARKQGKME